jgi:hypothetical protein
VVYTIEGSSGGATSSGFNFTRLTRPLVGQSPRVTGVYVASSGWTDTFRNYLASTGQGDAALGYRVTAAGQLLSLPWMNLDRISVRFDSNPDVEQADLVVRGVRSATYGFSDFQCDAAARTATWTLARAALNDKLLLDLDGGPGGVALNGVPMDGDWNNAGDAYPSGDRTPGGDFRFRLNVLTGDLDRNGAVIADDFSAVKRKFLSTTAATSPDQGRRSAGQHPRRRTNSSLPPRARATTPRGTGLPGSDRPTGNRIRRTQLPEGIGNRFLRQAGGMCHVAHPPNPRGFRASAAKT